MTHEGPPNLNEAEPEVDPAAQAHAREIDYLRRLREDERRAQQCQVRNEQRYYNAHSHTKSPKVPGGKNKYR